MLNVENTAGVCVLEVVVVGSDIVVWAMELRIEYEPELVGVNNSAVVCEVEMLVGSSGIVVVFETE